MALHCCFISKEARQLHGLKHALQQTEQYIKEDSFYLEDLIHLQKSQGFELLFSSYSLDDYSLIKTSLL